MSRASARWPPRRLSAIAASSTSPNATPRFRSRARLARRHEVAIGEALVDRLEHVEQHEAGEQVWRETGEPFDLGASQAAVDVRRRLEQAELAGAARSR